MDETPATRIFSIHQRLINKGRPDSYSMRDVWAEMFDIPKDSPHIDDWTIEAVMAFRAEVDLASKQLAALDVPPNLTNSVFPRLRDVANPVVFGQQWGQHKTLLQAPECALVLSWSAWVMRKLGEPQVEQAQFLAIKQHLSELDDLLQDPEVPPAIRNFVQRQVDDIRAALRTYPIQGIRALRRAVDTTTGAFAVPDDELVEEVKQATPKAMSVLKKAGQVLKETAEATGHVGKLAEAIKALSNYASEAGPTLRALGDGIIKQISG